MKQIFFFTHVPAKLKAAQNCYFYSKNVNKNAHQKYPTFLSGTFYQTGTLGYWSVSPGSNSRFQQRILPVVILLQGNFHWVYGEIRMCGHLKWESLDAVNRDLNYSLLYVKWGIGLDFLPWFCALKGSLIP